MQTTIHEQTYSTTFLLVNLPKHHIFLGAPWLRATNPKINWNAKDTVDVRRTSPAMEFAIDSTPTNVNEEIPSYIQDYQLVFSEQAAKRMPMLRPYDMRI